MAYAKACKYGCNTQIIWDSAASKFKENATGEYHTRERCEAAKTGGLGKYSPQGQKEFVEQYRPEQQQQQPKPAYRLSTNNPAFEKYNENKQTLESAAIQMINTKVDKCLELLNYIIDNTGTAKEISELKTVNAQLRAVLAKKDNFVPANQIPQQNEVQQGKEYDEHVRDMVKKGEQAAEEELDLT